MLRRVAARDESGGRGGQPAFVRRGRASRRKRCVRRASRWHAGCRWTVTRSSQNSSMPGYVRRAASRATRGIFRAGRRVGRLFVAAGVSPLRTEWFDDEIESLREFDVDQQTSLRSLDKAHLLLGTAEKESSHLRDYRQKTDLVISVDVPEVRTRGCSCSSSSGGIDAAGEMRRTIRRRILSFAAGFQRGVLISPALRESAESRVHDQLKKMERGAIIATAGVVQKRFRG